MQIEEAVVGAGVKCNVPFVDVPVGTKGKIIEDYGTGVMIEWFRPNSTFILKDGFDKKRELRYLDLLPAVQ